MADAKVMEIQNQIRAAHDKLQDAEVDNGGVTIRQAMRIAGVKDFWLNERIQMGRGRQWRPTRAETERRIAEIKARYDTD